MAELKNEKWFVWRREPSGKRVSHHSRRSPLNKSFGCLDWATPAKLLSIIFMRYNEIHRDGAWNYANLILRISLKTAASNGVGLRRFTWLWPFSESRWSLFNPRREVSDDFYTPLEVWLIIYSHRLRAPRNARKQKWNSICRTPSGRPTLFVESRASVWN